MEPDPSSKALEDALAAAEAALQTAIAAMIRDPALVSLMADRLLRAARQIRKARRALTGR